MNFDYSEEQELLRKTARDYLGEHAPLSLCREVLESEQPLSRALWKGVAELGWLGAAIPEEYGGAGLGHLELTVIAEELGRALAPIPFASSTCQATEAILLAGSEAQRRELLPKLASGDAIGTLAFAETAGQNAPDVPETRFEKGVLTGSKAAVADGDVATLAIVTARTGGEWGLALVDLTGEGVSRRGVGSLDPSRPLATLRFENAPAERLGAEGRGAELAAQILDRAAVLMAFEQLGGACRAFEITREFALGRYAFGRPIASFQALKHRLADLWCELELARSSCYYGAWALESNARDLGIAACISRVASAHAFDLASTEMIQMHGGVGFTWEHDCHLFYRRARFLALVLGNTASWRDRLIDRIPH